MKIRTNINIYKNMPEQRKKQPYELLLQELNYLNNKIIYLKLNNRQFKRENFHTLKTIHFL